MLATNFFTKGNTKKLQSFVMKLKGRNLNLTPDELINDLYILFHKKKINVPNEEEFFKVAGAYLYNLKRYRNIDTNNKYKLASNNYEEFIHKLDIPEENYTTPAIEKKEKIAKEIGEVFRLNFTEDYYTIFKHLYLDNYKLEEVKEINWI